MAEITVIGPDGAKYGLPEEQLADAEAQGYKQEPAAPAAAAPAVAPSSSEPISSQSDDQAPLPPAPSKIEGIPNPIPPEHEYSPPETDEDRVKVKDGDGKLFTIPGSQLKDALDQGYSQLSDRDNAVELAREKYKNEGITGLGSLPSPVESFLGGAENAIRPLAVALNSKLSDESPEGRAIEEEGREEALHENPKTEIAGRIAGELGTALATGAGAEATTAGLGLMGARKALVEGGIYGLQNATTELLNGNPGQAAESLAIGGILNVGLHGLGKLVSPVAKDLYSKIADKISSKAIPEIVTSAEEQRVAENKVMDELGVPVSKVESARPLLQDALKAVNAQPGQKISEIQKNMLQLEENGPEIGRAIKALDALPESSVDVADNTGGYHRADVIKENLSKAHAEISDNLGEASKEADRLNEVYDQKKKQLEDSIAKPEPTDPALKKSLKAEIASIRKEVGIAKSAADRALSDLPPDVKQARKAVGDIKDQIQSLIDKKDPTFQDMQALKKFSGELLPTFKNPGENTFQEVKVKMADGILRKHAANAEDTAAMLTKNPQIIEDLTKARRQYQIFKEFQPHLVKDLAKPEKSSNLLGMFVHRRAGIGTAAGAAAYMFGLPHVAGAVFGLNAAGGLLKTYMEKQGLKGAVRKVIEGSDNPAAMATLHAANTLNNNIDEGAKGLISHWTNAKLPFKIARSTGRAISNMVSENSTAKTDKERVSEISAANASAMANPTLTANRLGEHTQDLASGGLDQVAQATIDHQLRLMKVISSILPDEKTALAGAHPFSSGVDRPDIPDAIVTKFSRAMEVAQDPVSLLDRVKNNTITNYDVAVAAAVNPNTMNKLRQAVMTEAMKAHPNLTYQQRISASILMGTNIMDSAEQVPTLQSVFGQASAPNSPPGGKGSKGGKTLAPKDANDIAHSFLPQSQKNASSELGIH